MMFEYSKFLNHSKTKNRRVRTQETGRRLRFIRFEIEI
ncbi:hypothetical protein LEP1GSC137_2699 [Leptospira borgpetersenii str. Noumea 25]|nr:hypothetical protein LEP1GSC137_2699 [Leptospira borgpetersenii str. Noumea 25]